MARYRRETGRAREAREIEKFQRAAEVGRLMLGELRSPMEWICYDQYIDKPRREIKEQRNVVRAYLRDELEKFCRSNFKGVKPKDLANLYEPLYARGSSWRLSFIEFAELLGQPREGVLRGAPLHATVCLSYLWGLQTEYPEMHLSRDLAYSFNRATEAEIELEKYAEMPKSIAKTKKPEIAQLERSGVFHRRMCVLSCFNLVEAYVNGLAWDCDQTHQDLSKKSRRLLREEDRFVSIIDKLIKYPRIVARQKHGPLHQTQDPLKAFIEIIKPYRDSIVHASPFSAQERFGGYEKLSKIYELDMKTVIQTVDVTLDMISVIHQFVGGDGLLPSWMPSRKDEGTFEEVYEK